MTRAIRPWSALPRPPCAGGPVWSSRPPTKGRCGTRPQAGPRSWPRGCGCPTSSGSAATSPPAWPPCRPWTRRSTAISPRWPTNSTPRPCATASGVRWSPTRPKRWPSGWPIGRWCSPATVWPPWRWHATARRCCCGWRTSRWPRRDWPTPSWRYVAEWQRVSRARSTRCSTTRRSTGRWPAAPGCSRWPSAPSGRWSPRGWRDSMTSTWWGPRTSARRALLRCRRGAPNSSWPRWPSGWRWPRFILRLLGG